MLKIYDNISTKICRSCGAHTLHVPGASIDIKRQNTKRKRDGDIPSFKQTQTPTTTTDENKNNLKTGERERKHSD